MSWSCASIPSSAVTPSVGHRPLHKVVVITDTIQKFVAKLFGLPSATHEGLESSKDELAQELQGRGFDLFASRKLVAMNLKYCGVDFPIVVPSRIEVLNLRGRPRSRRSAF